jgi:hypothetical protein
LISKKLLDDAAAVQMIEVKQIINIPSYFLEEHDAVDGQEEKWVNQDQSRFLIYEKLLGDAAAVQMVEVKQIIIVPAYLLDDLTLWTGKYAEVNIRGKKERGKSDSIKKRAFLEND